MTGDVLARRPHKIDITDPVGAEALRADTLVRVTGADLVTIDRFAESSASGTSIGTESSASGMSIRTVTAPSVGEA